MAYTFYAGSTEINIAPEFLLAIYAMGKLSSPPKVSAIKMLRVHAGCGLKEAKDTVEFIWEHASLESSGSSVITIRPPVASVRYEGYTAPVYAPVGTRSPWASSSTY